MAEQSFKNHAHRPTETGILWLLAMVALVLMVQQFRGAETRDWAIVVLTLAMFLVGWISRAYIVRLQDRIIMLEMKVRAAEVLPAGQDAALAKLTKQQIVALRFASDEELGALLDRVVRENMSPKDIKAAVKTWRADHYRT
jgi:UDP-N-acetylmuramyl pentapeptide phosphotransferase/UDP-N-acetylglucosamine-1-phosphate transferase